VTSLGAELRKRATDWRDQDPDPETRAEIDQLIAESAGPELADRLGPELEFGTAGLRGAVGAGPSRMNRAVVVRAARALAEHWLAVSDAARRGVIVGYDARTSSRALAEAAAGVFLAAGVGVRWFEAPVPTPLVAYAARVLDAAGAVVITASHNPREDNGLKAYDGHALQLSSPDDAEVARRRSALPGARSIPCLSLVPVPSGLSVLGRELEERYLDDLEAILPEKTPEPALRVAYSPLHGVGLSLVQRALGRRGGIALDVVAEQAVPDGRFPTTPKPNPEEAGTMDRVLALGQRVSADLVVANDPDADRLAAAVPGPGGARLLTGNELGVLLADFVLARAPSVPPPLLVTTVVSTPLLAAVAREHGARCERTLTGFKWIWLAARALESEAGLRFAFGCEEALGYSIGHLVRDKDGIAAATWLAELARLEKSRGSTLLDRLHRVYRAHGAWASLQRSLVRPGQAGTREIALMVEHLGSAPPSELAGFRCSRLTDYRRDAESRPRWLGSALLLELELEPSIRVLVRPSGTEPKLKIYVDAREPCATDEAPDLALERARERASQVVEQMVRFLEASVSAKLDSEMRGPATEPA
jgi:phosphomannomutase